MFAQENVHVNFYFLPDSVESVIKRRKSKEEKRREQKKLYMRRAREKINSDPVALQALREKDRKRKMLGRKKISEIT